MTVNKRKIVNDPVHGFIRIPNERLFDLISHPYFQRLRRIRQMGLAELVYPGALHTRFHHALGAMHLMMLALDRLRDKGHEISEAEYEAATIAILLHDIGHGPFSHVLEHAILDGVPHEQISLLFMQALDAHFGGALEMAVAIFEDRYPRPFFHQLVSSQLDMDRLDYLQRDCFYTGVQEGKVGGDRIIRMLDVVDERIVIEEKGIYNVENFLNARRLMYWQVYLHKTSVGSEVMLVQLLRRARRLLTAGEAIPASEPLTFFLQAPIGLDDFRQRPECLEAFARLDDFDLWAAIKSWASYPDPVLHHLSTMLLGRQLFSTDITPTKPAPERIKQVRKATQQHFDLSAEEARYFSDSGKITNAGYLRYNQEINIKMKDGRILDVAQASDLPNIKALGKIVRKYYLSFPKVITL